MITLIKNIPSNAVVARGNRGLNFPLHTEWYSLLNVIPNLTIYNSHDMVIAAEPLTDTATLTEESIEEQNVFFVIPANPSTPQENIGTDPTSPTERIELV
jgi:hypothetical protein